MREAWAIREINEEVLNTSKQLGVNNIIFYGGPGVSGPNNQPDLLLHGRRQESARGTQPS